MRQSRIKAICRTAVMTATLSVLATISLPLPFTPIPLGLTNLAIMFMVVIFGPISTTIAVLVYIFLGIIGLPVFAGFNGGIGSLLGPTGGFIIGYIALCIASGCLIEILSNRTKPFSVYIVSLTVGTWLLYAFGCTWYIIISKVSFGASIMACVIPFVPLDMIKIVFVSIISVRYYYIKERR